MEKKRADYRYGFFVIIRPGQTTFSSIKKRERESVWVFILAVIVS